MKVDKRETVCFGASNHIPNNPISFTKNNKYPGIHLHKNLNFRLHINQLRTKLTRFCEMVYKLRTFLSRKHFLILYQAFAKSVINYGVLIYGCTYMSNLQNVLNIQKRIVIAIFFIENFNSVSENFLKNKIFSVFEQHVSVVLCELFKRLGDGSYDNVVHLNAEVSSRICTRRAHQGLLNPPRVRTKIREHSRRNKLMNVFNIL